MQTALLRFDPWQHAVASLEKAALAALAPDNGLDRPERTQLLAAARKRRSATLPRPSLTVKIIERLTHCTVAVSWHDATACCYDDQVWRAGVARRPGICALTAHPIRTGDPVYRPVNSARPPVNDGAMILATQLDAAIADLPGADDEAMGLMYG